MQIKSLPSVEEVTNNTIALDGRRAIVNAVIKERDNQAYTSLVEGIEGMKVIQKENEAWDTEQKTIAYGRNLVIRDILENVVRPLYGKE